VANNGIPHRPGRTDLSLVISFDIAHLAFGQNPHYASPVPILKQPAFRHDCLPKDVSYQSDQTKGQAGCPRTGPEITMFFGNKKTRVRPDTQARYGIPEACSDTSVQSVEL